MGLLSLFSIHYIIIRSDFKIWIAISTVVHITFAHCRLYIHNVQLYYLYIYLHTVLSPIIFFFMCYIYSHTRSRKTLYLNYSILVILTVFLWVGIPTAINFISELIMLTYTYNYFYFILVYIYFTLNIFILIKFVFLLQNRNPYHMSNKIIFILLLTRSVLLLDTY